LGQKVLKIPNGRELAGKTRHLVGEYMTLAHGTHKSLGGKKSEKSVGGKNKGNGVAKKNGPPGKVNNADREGKTLPY